MAKTETKYKVDDVAVFHNSSYPADPATGTHVVIISINPDPIGLMFGKGVEHYGIYNPADNQYGYASVDELTKKEG